MPDREIWQFGEQYIYIDDGSPASEEDVCAFKKRVEEGKKVSEEALKQREKAEKAWHEKYDSLIADFFGKHRIIKNWDDEWLAYNLAASLFATNGKNLSEIKQKFPLHWKAALRMYKEGNHDA